MFIIKKLKNNYISFIVLSNLFVFYFLWSFKNFFNYLSLIIILPFFFLKNISLNQVFFFLFFVIFFLIHLLFISPQFFFNESIYKILFLFVIFLFSLIFKKHILIEIKKLNYIFFGLLTFSIFINLFNFFINDNNLFFVSLFTGEACTFRFFVLRDNFFFKENSHIGIILSSVYLCTLYKISTYEKSIKLFFLFFYIILIFLNSSTTFYLSLLISCLIILLTNFNKIDYKFKSYLFLSLIVVLLIIIFERSCSERFRHFFPVARESSQIFIDNKNLNILENNEARLEKKGELMNLNLTTQVYVKSIFITIKSFISYPFGYGFDSYKIVHEKFENEIIYLNQDVKKYNREDASSMFLKLIVEYGFFSFFFFYLIFKYAISDRIDMYAKLFFLPMIISNFIRGTGYFKAGFLISAFIIFLLIYEKKINLLIERFIKLAK